MASEKGGLAVNKKGLTLKELLQQTSHHNPKVRRGTFLLFYGSFFILKVFYFAEQLYVLSGLERRKQKLV